MNEKEPRLLRGMYRYYKALTRKEYSSVQDAVEDSKYLTRINLTVIAIAIVLIVLEIRWLGVQLLEWL